MQDQGIPQASICLGMIEGWGLIARHGRADAEAGLRQRFSGWPSAKRDRARGTRWAAANEMFRALLCLLLVSSSCKSSRIAVYVLAVPRQRNKVGS